MSCPTCAVHLAHADQLEGEVADKKAWANRLLEQIQKRDIRIEHLERQLRETLDELRVRRQETGYLPVLDHPEG